MPCRGTNAGCSASANFTPFADSDWAGSFPPWLLHFQDPDGRASRNSRKWYRFLDIAVNIERSKKHDSDPLFP